MTKQDSMSRDGMSIDRRYVRAATAATAMLAFITTTACTTTDPDTPTPSTQATGSGGEPGGDGDAEQRRAGRATGSVALGDLDPPKNAEQVGAPFDPCGLAWGDFPAPVRPTDGAEHAPQLRPAGGTNGVGLRCVYSNSGKVTINPDGPPTGPEGGVFSTTVVWDRNLQTDPAKVPGSTTKTWGGHPGWIVTTANDKTGPQCSAVITLADGAAGITTANNRFPQTPPCEVVEALAAVIVTKTR
ncbi:hypothetical protein [Actinokineospora bangkokensis]|uniref:DUF3558 domain-containing protein n=1 Tax=Actinokineospora bangkokensis TaxID=1193682 RepID=A0A1Q9LKQ2_9PSEU|nr:hypothetical protein [Actinokineospora bangkokensis]OLR91073.1 hypothetical protein BJP25_31550 [Actinokineospora bangkokensis]OLR92574.1 hypothetical protein BJP25_21205 [Actinokineospora bangkokensis]